MADARFVTIKRKVFGAALAGAFILTAPLALADRVIMKDGKIYKGKILAENETNVLIGNPPFDPTTYLLDVPDIEKIVYEE